LQTEVLRKKQTRISKIIIPIQCIHWLSYTNKALKHISNTEINREEHISTFNGLPTRRKLELLTQQGRISEIHHNVIWHKKQEFTKETIIENYPSNTLIDYYDIIHKLLEAITLKAGVKARGEGAHQELIDYVAKQHNIDEDDTNSNLHIMLIPHHKGMVYWTLE